MSASAPTRESADAPLLELTDVSKEFPIRQGLFGRRAVHAVDGVNLTIRQGEILSLVGESGSGKTTLGRCVTGMTAPTSGTVRFEGRDLATLSRSERLQVRKRVQPVFQDPRSSLDPRWSVARSIQEPLDAYSIGTRSERSARVLELMEMVGLPSHFAHRRSNELSGGQQQRVAIAAALALDPELIVADEPVSALDVSVQAQVLNLLSELRTRLNVAFLFITHDLSVVEHLSDRVAVMYLGRVVEDGTVSDIFEHPVHPYTQALIGAIPRPDPGQRISASRLHGEIPSLVNPPSGCRFHTRCPIAIDRCAVDDPQLASYGPSHLAACHVAAERTREVAVR